MKAVPKFYQYPVPSVGCRRRTGFFFVRFIGLFYHIRQNWKSFHLEKSVVLMYYYFVEQVFERNKEKVHYI